MDIMSTLIDIANTLEPFVVIASFTLIAMVYSKKHFPDMKFLFFDISPFTVFSASFMFFLITLGSIGFSFLSENSPDFQEKLIFLATLSFAGGIATLFIASFFVIVSSSKKSH